MGDLKFRKIKQNCAKHLDEVKNFINYWDKERHKFPFEIDGIVLKVNSLQQQNN